MGGRVSLHVTMKELRHASRIARCASALVGAGIVDRVMVTGIVGGSANEFARPARGVAYLRLALRSKGLPRMILAQAVKELERTWIVVGIARRVRPVTVSARSAWDLPCAYLAARFTGAALIYEPHELEAGRVGMGRFRSAVVRAIEWAFGRRAAACVAVGECIAERYSRQLGIPCFTVMNVPGPSPRLPVAGLRDRCGCPPGEPLLAYVGALVGGRGLGRMARAVGLSRRRWRLAAIGPGSLDEASAVALRGHGWVLGPVAPAEVVSVVADADLSAVLIEPVCESYRLSMPNKLFESLRAGVPVLASDLPELGGFVRRHGVGALVAPDASPEELAKTLDAITPDQLERWRAAIPAALADASGRHGPSTLAAAYRVAMAACGRRRGGRALGGN